jgi:hypothetical protein
MKKMFSGLVLAALAVLPACNSDETVDVPTGRAIEFAGSFVDNSTRSTDPSYTTSSLKEFYVYGWVEKDGTSAQIFDSEKVTHSDGSTFKPAGWSYDNKRYWVDGGAYTFAAIAGATDNGTLVITNTDAPTIKGFTSDGNTDLIYSENKEMVGKASNNEAVSFNFQHQLAKIKFSFQNQIYQLNEEVKCKVRNIKMANPIVSGDVTLSATQYGATWTNQQQGETALDFGNAGDEDGFIAELTLDNASQDPVSTCDYERLIIPADADQTYNVTFDADIYLYGIFHQTVNCTAIIKNVAFQPGYAYNFTAVLNNESLGGGISGLEPIKFDNITVEGWTENDNNSATWTKFTPEGKTFE